MNSASLVALDLGTIMAVVLVTTTPLKALLEVFVPQEARAHDALIQLLALCVGVLWSFVVVWAEGGLTRKAELELIISVLLGVGGGSAAVGAFHVTKTVTAARPPPSSPPQTSQTDDHATS